MKRREFDCYKTLAVRGWSRLAAEAQSLDEMRVKIDAANERAVSQGYKAEQWLITHEERYVWYSDDGVFVKSEIIEEAIEVYPAQL